MRGFMQRRRRWMLAILLGLMLGTAVAMLDAAIIWWPSPCDYSDNAIWQWVFNCGCGSTGGGGGGGW